MEKVSLLVVLLSKILAAEPTFDNLMELPMNMAGYMSVERASDECEEQVITAVDITIEEANKRCEEAVRQNIYNIERQDDDVLEQVMEATRSTEEKKCKNIVEASLKEAEIIFEKKCMTYTEQAKQIARNEVDAECRVIIDNKIRHAIITDRRESEKHCRNILEQQLLEQKKSDKVQCSVDSQVAVQHAVDMAVKTGRDALVSAVDQTEKRCETQVEKAVKEVLKNATEECVNKTDYKIRDAEDRVKKEWGKDLVNLRKLFKEKMEETRKRWIGEMIEAKQTVDDRNIKDGEEIRDELNKISSESFILLDEGSGSNPNSIE